MSVISINEDRGRHACVASRLRMSRNRLNHRQLKYCHALSFEELRHEHVGAIRKFDRIMVAIRNALVYRAELPHSEINHSLPKPSVVVFDSFGERQFGPGEHADRYRGLTFGCEATS